MAKPNSFGDIICEKLLSDPYVIFIVTAAMLFDGSKISTLILRSIPQGTSIPSLVPIGEVVSEEKGFENLLTTRTTTTDDDDGGGRTPSDGNSSHMTFGRDN